MPEAIPVELAPHCSGWSETAAAESRRLIDALAGVLVDVHHIGSTSIPGIVAKPIIDLMPITTSARALDQLKQVFRELGYQYWGEYGIVGRRYCTLDDRTTGKRRFQLHCFEPESAEVERHLAFRDYLRSNAAAAKAYEAEKWRCRNLHPDNSHAYSDAKSSWIAAKLPDAVAHYRSSH
jgi:GrpB-like predicted nucleotidyltransferase (UPF0157 family)